MEAGHPTAGGNDENMCGKLILWLAALDHGEHAMLFQTVIQELAPDLSPHRQWLVGVGRSCMVDGDHAGADVAVIENVGV